MAIREAVWRALAGLACSIAAVMLAVSCGGASSTSAGGGKFSGTIHIASSTWTGYAALYVADKKSFWKQHGLDVDFTDVEDPVQRLNALNAGQLQGMASTVDAFARAASQGVPAVQVFPIDASVGGDGILARNEIQSVKDLKGKTVAVNQGSVSEWFLAQVLKRNGMSLNDVKEQNRTWAMRGLPSSPARSMWPSPGSPGFPGRRRLALADYWSRQRSTRTSSSTASPS